MSVTAHPASQSGIDPHDLPLSLRLMRGGFKALRLVSLGTAAKVAGRLFVKPRRHAVPERERQVLSTGARSTVRHGDKDIAVWTFEPKVSAASGSGPKTAILVHGWEGRGGQMGAFIAPLLAKGFRVVTFDHVGHGESDGIRCALPTMRDTLRCVANAVVRGTGEDAPAAIVAHSMGSFAASLLLAESWRGARVVYVSPPDDLLVYFSRYLDIVTGDTDLLPHLIQQMEERFGESVEEFEFRKLVETLDQPLCVFHSRDDVDVPIEAGRFVAEHWPGAVMREVDGLGHRRILRDSGVVESSVAFLCGDLGADPVAEGMGEAGSEDDSVTSE